jgi:hypothetical protein
MLLNVARTKGVTSMITRVKMMIRRLGKTERQDADVWRDPLSHPSIRAMSARELADLPFPSGPTRKR